MNTKVKATYNTLYFIKRSSKKHLVYIIAQTENAVSQPLQEEFNN